jgi:hypothetical protein
MRKIKFILVGPNQGKSGVWGGYVFVDGVCEVDAQWADNARVLLGRYYSAYPDIEVSKQADGTLVWDNPDAVLEQIPEKADHAGVAGEKSLEETPAPDAKTAAPGKPAAKGK